MIEQKIGSDLSSIDSQLGSEFAISAEELESLERLKRYVFRKFTEKAYEDPALLEKFQVESSFHTFVDATSVFNGSNGINQDFGLFLIAVMSTDLQLTPSLKSKLIHKSAPDIDIATYFFQYLDGILRGQITKDDLSFLFMPLNIFKHKKGSLSESEKNTLEQIENCRKLLLIVAHSDQCRYSEGFPRENLDLEKIIEKRKQLPSGEKNLFFEAIEFFSAMIQEKETADYTISSLGQMVTGIFIEIKYRQPIERYLTPAGFSNKPPKINKDHTSVSKRLMTLGSMLKTLKEDGHSLSEFEDQLIETIINDYSNDEDKAKFYRFSELIDTAQKRAQIHFIEERVVTEAIPKIEQLKAHASATAQQLPATSLSNDLEKIEALATDSFFEKEVVLTADITGYFESSDENPILDKEMEELKKGLEEAQEILKKDAIASRALKSDKQEEFASKLDSTIETTTHICDTLYQDVMDWARETKPAFLRKALNNPQLYTEQEVFDLILQRYQSRIRPTEQDPIETKANELTQFLFASTLLTQLKKAKDQPENLFGMLQAAQDFERHKAQDGTINEHMKRKFLVTEYQHGIIMRDGQIRIIQEIAKDPSQLKTLRMGLGKTSYIMPLIANILAEEQAKTPILFVPRALSQMNQASFDSLTRQCFERASYVFTSSIEDPITAGYLSETYTRLLEAKKQKGYVITDVESAANIKNLLINRSEQLSHIIDEIGPSIFSQIQEQAQDRITRGDFSALSSPEQFLSQCRIETTDEDRTKTLEALKLWQEIHWLTKIESFFADGIIFGDESDEIWRITNEINRGTSEKRPPERCVSQVCEDAFTLLLSKDHEDANLQKMKELVLSSVSTVPTEQQLKCYLKAWTKALLQSPSFEGYSHIDIEELVDYITGEELDDLPRGLPEEFNDDLKSLVALKHLMSTTLKGAFLTSPDLNYGFSKDSGYLVVPRVQKQEAKGTRFGDEYDLITFQYLGWLFYDKCHTQASDAFIKKSLEQMEKRYPEKYEEIKQNAEEKRLTTFAYLKLQEAFPHRLFILNAFVFDPQLIKVNKEQITLSVQETIMTRNLSEGSSTQSVWGGVTGTQTPFAMPRLQTLEGESKMQCFTPSTESPRLVEAETILRVATSNTNKQGLNTPLSTFSEFDVELKNRLNDTKCTALINEAGFGMEGMNTLEWVEKLRTIHEERDIIFVHPEYRIRYVWKSGKQQLPEVLQDRTPLNNPIVVYGPEDMRGTDIAINPGKVIYYPSSTTNLQTSGQSLWRARGLGRKHHVICAVPNTFAQALSDENEGKSPTIGLLFERILKKGLEQQLPLNVKAQLFRLNGEVKSDLRANLLYPEETARDDKEYWNLFKNTAGMFNDIFHHVLKYQMVRDEFIKSKAIDFARDYQPAQSEEVMESLVAMHEAKAPSLAEKMRANLQRWVEKRQESLGMLKNFIPTLISSSYNSTLERVGDATRKAKIELEENQEAYKAYLPPNLPKVGAGEGNVQEQIQEQVQEQQVTQEVQTLSGTAGVSRKKRDIRTYPQLNCYYFEYLINAINIFDPNEEFPITANKFTRSTAKGAHYPSTAEVLDIDVNPKNFNVYFSPRAADLYKEMPIFNGNQPIFRALICGNAVIIISSQDLARIMENPNDCFKRPLGDHLQYPRNNIQKLGENESFGYQIFSFEKDRVIGIHGKKSRLNQTSSEEGQFPVPVQAGEEHKNINSFEELSETIQLALVQARFFLGYSDFSDREKELWQNYVSSLPAEKRAQIKRWVETKGNKRFQEGMI